MPRNIIRPEFPFTQEEVAAAWIVQGMPSQDALESARALAEAITSSENIQFGGGFDAALYLLTDVHADGDFLSDEARQAWLDQWSPQVRFHDVESILDKLAALGDSWSQRRAPLRELLTYHT